MDILPIVLGLAAGICIGTGIIYLFIGIRRRDNERLHLTFALFALAYAGANITAILEYKTTSLEHYLQIGNWTALFTGLALILLLWFVAIYTQVQPRIFLVVLTAVIALVVTIAIIQPNFIHSEIFGIVPITLPWGETINLLDASESIWGTIFFLSEIALVGFAVYACVRQYLSGERQKARALSLGLVFLLFALIFDIIFIDSGRLNFVFLGDYGFLPLAIVMGIQLANQVLETEDELTVYRQNLESLVEERTRELGQTNLLLIQEIEGRQQVEDALHQSERRTRALIDAYPDSALLLDPDGVILDINEVAANRLAVKISEAKGANAFDLFEPGVAEIRKEKMDELLTTKRPVRWEDERSGWYFDNNMYPILDDDGNVSSIAVYGADISEHYRAEETLRQRIEDLNFLNQVGHVVTSASNLPIALQRLAELITRHFKARYTHIIFRTIEIDELINLVGYDLEIGTIEQTSIDISLADMPLTGRVLEKGESLVESDVQTITWSPSVREFLLEHQIRCLMLVPIKMKGEIVGLIAVTCDQVDRIFTEDEVQLAETVAADISRVMESTRLQEKELQAAAGEERRRLARDLHDAVTQTIYSASLIAEVLPVVWERNPTEGQRNLVKLRQLVRGALAEMRTLLFELRPASLEAADLTTLLRHLSDALTGRTRIPVTFQTAGESHPPTEVKIAFYRIAQEAFNNIAKHSEATQVTVELQSDSNQVKLTVGDDGRGFDQNNVAEDKLGVQIMTERANEIDARLELNTTPAKGTQISVTWSGEEYNNAQTLD